jgi:large subunit ribosomal protein L25
MEFKINAQPRTLTGKKVKTLRKQGLVPAGIYGFKGNVNVQLSRDEFTKLFKEAGHTAVIQLDLEGKKHNVIVDEVQMNYVEREITHVTLREVNMNVEISAEIPLELVGEENSPAVKEESSLIILTKSEVLLKGLPSDLPQKITIDVSNFKAGDTLTLKDISIPSTVTVVHEEELEATYVMYRMKLKLMLMKQWLLQ